MREPVRCFAWEDFSCLPVGVRGLMLSLAGYFRESVTPVKYLQRILKLDETGVLCLETLCTLGDVLVYKSAQDLMNEVITEIRATQVNGALTVVAPFFWKGGIPREGIRPTELVSPPRVELESPPESETECIACQ